MYLKLQIIMVHIVRIREKMYLPKVREHEGNACY